MDEGWGKCQCTCQGCCQEVSRKCGECLKEDSSCMMIFIAAAPADIDGI